MPKATEYCVALDNKPGTLAKLTASLAKAKVNVTAISTSENTQCNWIRLVAGPGPKVKKVLVGGKYHYCSQSVLTVAVRDEPGQLARVSERLAKAGVNINYLYGSSGRDGAPVLVFNVSDLSRAAKVAK
jgi:hypothetical protein